MHSESNALVGIWLIYAPTQRIFAVILAPGKNVNSSFFSFAELSEGFSAKKVFRLVYSLC